MRFAFYNVTTTVKSGGVETFYREMANIMSARGHDIHLYTGRGGDVRDISPQVTIREYPFIERDRWPDFGTRFRKFMERLSFAFHAFGDLKRGRYDYIYTRKPYDLPAALLASRFSGARVIYGSGGTEFFPGYKQLVKKVDLFFACSGYNADQIENYCGVRPLVLYNGVNIGRFKPLEPDLELRSRYNPAGNSRVLITACRLIGWKGVDYAVRAVSRLIRDGHDLVYLIIGDGEARHELEALVRDSDLHGKIHFLGRLPNFDLPRYYSIADLALFPSIGAETFGITIGEAMACGVPVVSTRVGGIPEVVGDEGGLLVDPRDEMSLLKGIKTMMFDDELREEFSHGGRARVVNSYTWDKTADNLERHIDMRKEGALGKTA